MDQHGVFYEEAVAKLLNASMDAPRQQLESENKPDTRKPINNLSNAQVSSLWFCSAATDNQRMTNFS